MKYADILALLAALIDGKYAASMADIRIVASVGSNTLWLSTIANTNRNETVAQVLRSNGVTWMTRGDIDTATANGDFGAFIGLQRGIAECWCGSGVEFRPVDYRCLFRSKIWSRCNSRSITCGV